MSEKNHLSTGLAAIAPEPDSPNVRLAAKKILVYGYGNTGWQDDAVGVKVTEALQKQKKPDVDFYTDFQLYPEQVELIAGYKKILFIDAIINTTQSGIEPFIIKKLKPVSDLQIVFTYSSHYLCPEGLLALCQEYYNYHPEAWLVGIKIFSLELTSPLTEQAGLNAETARKHVSALLDEWLLAYNSADA